MACVAVEVGDYEYRDQDLFRGAATVAATTCIDFGRERFVTEGAEGAFVVQNLVFLVTDGHAAVPGSETTRMIAGDAREIEAGNELGHVSDAVV